jgi:hypothetical protein
MECKSGQRRGAVETSGKSFTGSMRRVCSVALLFTAIACSPSTLARESTPSSSPNLITADEISKTSVQNALEAVQKLRPAMLKRATMSSANAQSRGEIVIYVDNTRYGAVDNLRQIPSSSIAVVRYFSASESQLKWGSGHPGGVIEVVTKR